MGARASALLAAVALAALVSPRAAQAVELDVGAEAAVGGAVGGPAGNGPYPSGGLLIQLRVSPDPLELSLWTDLRSPVPLIVGSGELGGGSGSPSYLPLGLGLRAGLALWEFRPYAGLLATSELSTPGSGAESFLALGGELGVDYLWRALRLGAEARLTTTLNPTRDTEFFCPGVGGCPSEQGVTLFEVLASLRYTLELR